MTQCSPDSATPMQRLLAAAGWDVGSIRHKKFEDALVGAGLSLVETDRSAPAQGAPFIGCSNSLCVYYAGRKSSTPPQAAHQPIETAPKDGTHILAWRVPIGIRVTNLTNPPTVVHWFDDPDDPGFYTSVNERAPDYPFKATHWMPLPPGPSLSRPNVPQEVDAEIMQLVRIWRKANPQPSKEALAERIVAALTRPLRQMTDGDDK